VKGGRAVRRYGGRCRRWAAIAGRWGSTALPPYRLTVLSVLSALSVVSVLSCEESGARPTATVNAPDSADQVLEGFSHFVTNQGVRRSRVEADSAYFYEATQITHLRKLRVVFYNAKGEEGSTLTAKAGTYRWQDGSMEADSNVVVVAPDGRRLATERLRYDNATNTISTDRRFSFDRGAEHLEGNSFKSDPDFRNVVTDKPRGVAGNGMLLPGQEESQR
jgi:LPS export ABC transporter protein LptC